MTVGISSRRTDQGVMLAGAAMLILYASGLLEQVSPSLAELIGPFTDPAEGPVEVAQAVFWLLSGIAFVIVAAVAAVDARRSGEHLLRALVRGKVLWPAFIGLVCIAAFGEETSWGQHLGLTGPSEDIAAINTQGELNVHNLNVAEILGLDADHPLTPFLKNFGGVLQPAFYLFWFTAWVLLPIVIRRGWPPQAFWRGYPLPALSVAVFFSVNLLAWFIVDRFYEVTELFELAIALSSSLVAVPAVVAAISRPGREQHRGTSAT